MDVDIHIAWGSPDGRTWTVPIGTGLRGQHCQPIALGGDRLLAVYSHRADPPGIHAALSEDFGRTWDPATEVVVWASDAGTEPGADRPRPRRTSGTTWAPGSSGIHAARSCANGEVLVTFYGGSGVARSARWARLRV